VAEFLPSARHALVLVFSQVVNCFKLGLFSFCPAHNLCGPFSPPSVPLPFAGAFLLWIMNFLLVEPFLTPSSLGFPPELNFSNFSVGRPSAPLRPSPSVLSELVFHFHVSPRTPTFTPTRGSAPPFSSTTRHEVIFHFSSFFSCSTRSRYLLSPQESVASTIPQKTLISFPQPKSVGFFFFFSLGLVP